MAVPPAAFRGAMLVFVKGLQCRGAAVLLESGATCYVRECGATCYAFILRVVEKERVGRLC